jgi:predicted dehydrogenase
MAKGNRTQAVSRRSVLGAAAAGIAAPYMIPSGVLAAPGRPGPNDRINIALIGANGQGNYDMNEVMRYPDVAVVAVCEVGKDRLEQTLARINTPPKEGNTGAVRGPGTAKGYNDYREVLARKDIDAVIIATSPHWHARMCVDAAEAGKDFYCEKPMTIHLAESLVVKRAAEKHKVITQVGTQIHAHPNYRRCVDIIRSGVLGKISTARTFHVLNQGPEGIGMAPDTDPPSNVDWDMWLGPAPERKFNALLYKDSAHHPSWMISGGWTPGMAPHIIDLPWWALELGFPEITYSSGGRYLIQDCGDAYDFQEIIWQFPKFTLTWWTSLVNNHAFHKVLQAEPNTGRRRGQFYHGVDATLIADYAWHEVVPQGDRLKDYKEDDVPKVIPESPGHHREWLDGIRSRQQPSCHVGYHYKLDVALNLGMLSMKLGRSIRFDPATESIVGDAEAARLAIPQYRPPWKFPAEYLKTA